LGGILVLLWLLVVEGEDGFDDFLHGLCGGGFGMMIDEGLALVAGLGNGGVDGDAANEGDVHFLSHGFAAALLEDVADLLAVGAAEAAHVFDDADDGDLELFAEVDAFADVGECDLLGGGDDDGTVGVFEELDDGEGFVAGAGGRVDDEVVEVAPFDVLKELFDDVHFHGASPDEGVVVVFEEQGDGHDL